jgi:Beta/Gamma crystallin
MQGPTATMAALVIATAVSWWAPRLATADELNLEIVQSSDNSLVLYSEEGYEGSATPFEVEQANLSVLNWNNEAESLRIRPGDIWEVCTEPDFSYCVQVDGDIPDLSNVGLNREISSIRPLRQNDPAWLRPLLGRTAGFFPTPRIDREPVQACPTGGTKQKCVQKQANLFCQQQGYKDSPHHVVNEGILEEVVCKN